LANRLQNELLKYVTELEPVYDELRHMLFRVYKRNSVVSLGLAPILKLFSKPIGNIKFLFYGSKYLELITSLTEDDKSVGIIGGPKQWALCQKLHIPFFSNAHAWQALAKTLNSKPNEKRLQQLLEEFSSSFRGSDNRYLILDNDSVPMQRLLSLAASTAGVRTIYLQDGLLQNASPDAFLIGRHADFVFSYDMAQANVFKNKGIPEDKVRVMGFYSDHYKKEIAVLRAGASRKVCILGQPWFECSKNIGEFYLMETMNLLRTLKQKGFELYFKPHPREKKESYLTEISGFAEIQLSTMNEAVRLFDVFLAYSSTALYEATLHDRVAIQLWHENFGCDKFQNIGYAYTLELDDQTDMAKLSDTISHNSPFGIHQSDEIVSDRFLKCIETLPIT